MAKILIIEDDPYVRRFYEKLFHLNNYDVDIAADGTEGLQKAIKGQPSLILLDIVMPKINGLKVLEELKRNQETKECHVVMLTNIDNTQVIAEATRLGASDFVIKSSAPPEKLLEIVEKYFESQTTN